MTTTHKALEDRMAAASRLTSMGVLSPRRTSRDEEWEAAVMKASEEAIRTGLPVTLPFPSRGQPDQGQN